MKPALVLCLALVLPAFAQPIQRSAAEVRAFRKEAGCWPPNQVDHIQPIKCGGADERWNFQCLTPEQHKEKTKREASWCLKPRKRAASD